MLPADPRPGAISALAFDAQGERVAALSVVPPPTLPSAGSGRGAGAAAGAASNVLRVWALELGFTQRLQQLRGPVSIEPIVCKSVSGSWIRQEGVTFNDELHSWFIAVMHSVPVVQVNTMSAIMWDSQVAVHKPNAAASGSVVLDLGFQVKWQPSGKVVAVTHNDKVLTMQAC